MNLSLKYQSDIANLSRLTVCLGVSLMRWYDCFSFIHSHAEDLCHTKYGLLLKNVSFLVWLGVIANYIPVAQQVATLLFLPTGP